MGVRRKLNARQAQFVAEYVRTKNGAQAAIAAGYSPNGAASKASQLLKNINVARAVDAGLGRVIKNAEVTLERMVLEIARIAMADPADAYDDSGALKPVKEWPEDLRRSLAGIESKELEEWDPDTRRHIPAGVVQKVKFWPKTAALEQAMKHLGGYQKDNEQKGKSLAELLTIADEIRDEEKK